MSFRHNKKRNVGLVYEFLVRHLSRCVLEGNDAGISKVRSILGKHFNPSTDLGKELRIFKALYESKVANVEAAKMLLGRAKKACEAQSQSRLDLEKTGLIHEINVSLQDSEFFDRPVKDYKLLASIQILLNEWRSRDLLESVSAESVELEQKLLEHLVRDTAAEDRAEREKLAAVQALTPTDVDKLALRLFYEKFNKRYTAVLCAEQKQLLAAYVTEKPAVLVSLLENIHNAVEPELEKAFVAFSGEPTTIDNLKKTKQLLESFKTRVTGIGPEDAVAEDIVEFYLKAINLKSELLKEDKEGSK